MDREDVFLSHLWALVRALERIATAIEQLAEQKEDD